MSEDFASRTPIKPPEGREATYEFAGWKPKTFLKQDGKPWPAWESLAITRIPVFPLDYIDGGKVTKIAVHKLAAVPLAMALLEVNKAGLVKYLSPYGGGYEFRLQRGSGFKLSMHALGLAVDFDPEANPLGCPPGEGRFDTEEGQKVVAIMALYGWYWGGHFQRRDPMHFQFARGV